MYGTEQIFKFSKQSFQVNNEADEVIEDFDEEEDEQVDVKHEKVDANVVIDDDVVDVEDDDEDDIPDEWKDDGEIHIIKRCQRVVQVIGKTNFSVLHFVRRIEIVHFQ